MKRLAMMALLMAVPALVALAADDKPVGPDGVYKVTALTKGGKKAPDEELKALESLTIKGDKMTMKIAGVGTHTASIKVDAKAKPATIDLIPDDGPDKGETKPGIWKLEKDVLTIALAEGKDAKRPADFNGKGKDDIVIVLTKDEPKKDEPKKDDK